jgi:hypothetical protein
LAYLRRLDNQVKIRGEAQVGPVAGEPSASGLTYLASGF